jgi:hypothetical protein
MGKIATNSIPLRYDGVSVGTDSDVSEQRDTIIFKDQNT